MTNELSASWVSPRDERNTKMGCFYHYPDPVMCVVQSDDINWSFFGMKVLDKECDLIDECFDCWPLCAYCWHICDPDGVCYDDECLTNETWAWKASQTITGPPWFRRAYTEIVECLEQNPWRPKPTVRWRLPLVPTAADQNLYYLQALEAFQRDSMREVWLSLHVLSFPPTNVKWP